MQYKSIPITELKVSRLNMRHGRKAPDIDDIYPSIKSRGVLQTMLVRKEGSKFGVVAGRRRFFALKRLAKETGQPQKAPCLVMQSGDDIAALEATLVENTTHLPTDEFQQYEVFAKLAAKGEASEDIADRFGVTDLAVRRVLALTALTPEIKALYEAEAIDKRTLYALTLATKDQQAAWLALYESEDDYAPHGERLKDWLTGGGRITTDKALFDLDTYDGTVLTDLFGENALFADVDLFWTLQNQAIADMAAAYKADGWAEVTVMERGANFLSWDHGNRAKSDGGRVYIETRHDGTVTAHEGYLPLKDIRKIDAILKRTKDGENGKPDVRPELSGSLAEYIALHRHAAIRASLLDHPGVALRLAVAHLVTGADHWRVEVEDQHTRKEATAESVGTSKAERLFREQCSDACAALDFTDGAAELVRGEDRHADVCAVFARLLTLDDAAVLRILTVAMGETLAAGSAAIEAAGHVIGADIGALWSPDEAFFGLVRDKRAINAMLADCASEATARSMVTETGPAQKQAIRNRMAGHGCEARPDWRPRWMRVPPASYVDGAACPPADTWEAIAPLFESEDEQSAPDDPAQIEPIAA